MNLFDFVTQDELDDLPEEPNLALISFVRHAQRRLADRTKELDPENQSEWQLLDDARHGFMNVVIAAAKRFGVEPFATIEVPRLDQFSSDVHRQFKADLDHYMTQLLLDNTIRAKRDSVLLPEKSKDRIRSHLHGLKTCIDNADFSDAKKSALLKKLANFENELDKIRLNILAVAWVTLQIMAIPGALWASGDAVAKLVTNVLHEVGEAKAAEDEARQLPPVEAPAALSAPRKEKSDAPASADFDDEIPF